VDSSQVREAAARKPARWCDRLIDDLVVRAATEIREAHGEPIGDARLEPELHFLSALRFEIRVADRARCHAGSTVRSGDGSERAKRGKRLRLAARLTIGRPQTQRRDRRAPSPE